MATIRTLLEAFLLANRIYANASVTVWEADDAGQKTSVKATLYAAQTGSATLANPQTLDGEGKLQQPVYHDVAVIITVDGLSVGTHQTGVIKPDVDDSDIATSTALARQAIYFARAAEASASAAGGSEASAEASAAAALASEVRALALSRRAFEEIVAQSGFLLAANNLVDLTDIPAAFSNIKQAASQSTTGVVEQLSQSELDALIDSSRYPTAAQLAAWSAWNWIDDPIVNSSFYIFQRINAAAIADNAFGIDAWRALTEGGTLAMSQALTGSAHPVELYADFAVGTGNNKFGVLNVIEQTDVFKMRGGEFTFGCNATVSNARVGDVRIGILEWTGTGNAVTGDPISAWNAAGADPTLAANWAYLNTPANLDLVSGSFSEESVTVTIGNGAVNIGIFVWCDDKTTNNGDSFRLAHMRCNRGQALMPPRNKKFTDELLRCQRRLWKSFIYATAPAQNIGAAGSLRHFIPAGASTATGFPILRFPVPMLATPGVTLFNTSAANAQVRNLSAGADCSASAAGSIDETGFRVNFTTPGGGAANQDYAVHAVASAEI